MSKTFLHPDDAAKMVTHYANKTSKESVPIDKLLGRVIANTLEALVEQPPFDKSAMDGYAYCKNHTNQTGLYTQIQGVVIAAGDVFDKKVEENQCVKIMTGACIPEGCNAVQRVEFTEIIKQGEIVKINFAGKEHSSNIIKKGENQKIGSTLLSKRILSAKDIGILASSGYSEVMVRKPVRVGVVSTGGELCEVGVPLTAGQIYNSNGHQIFAQASSIGCDVKLYGIVKDDLKEITDVFANVMRECDVLLVSGGVSMGDFDYIPIALENLGVKQVFHGLAMKPGKPCYFGKKDSIAVFGLPGNPVSTFVAFEVVVKPYIYSCLGLDYKPARVFVEMTEAFHRREADRLEYIPAILTHSFASQTVQKDKEDEGSAIGSMHICTLPYLGSSALASLANANALIRIEVGVHKIEAGGYVHARLI